MIVGTTLERESFNKEFTLITLVNSIRINGYWGNNVF